MSQIKDDFNIYKSPSGLYSNNPGGSSGNDLLFTAESIICLQQAGEWKLEDDNQMEQAVINHCQTIPGLFNRGPGFEQDQEGPDDYVGLGIISEKIAAQILDYGWFHLWYMKTSNSARWYQPIFLRFPALIAHLNWCAGRKPNWFLRLAWAFSVAFGNKYRDQDSYILNALLCYVAQDKGWLEHWAYNKYKKALESDWGTLKICLTAYFNNPEAPIAKYWQEI